MNDTHSDPQDIYSLFDVPGLRTYINPGVRGQGLSGPPAPHDVPAIDTMLWRYMNFEKFVSLLEMRELYFTRADKLDDPYEGAWSEATLSTLDTLIAHGDDTEHVDSETGDKHVSQREGARIWRNIIRGHSSVDRRYTLINCWREGTRESEAMWNQSPRHGERHTLAVKTDFKSMVRSFPPGSRVPDMIARVQYIPYEAQQMPLSLSAPYFHKRIEFQDEREVRATMNVTPMIPDPNHPDRDDVQAPDYSKDVCEVGMGFEIDPAALIHGVVISPHAPAWLTELTASVVKRYGYDFPVTASRLRGEPRWG